MLGFMIRVAVGLYELTNGSLILTRRGGTDANAPERLRTAIRLDWHVGILGSHFWKFLKLFKFLFFFVFLKIYKIFSKIVILAISLGKTNENR